MKYLKNDPKLYLEGKLDLSFESVKWLYISVMLIFPSMALVYPLLLPNAFDPLLLRLAIGALVLAVYLVALVNTKVRNHISYYTISFYYILTAHTFYLIYMNNMAVEYVIGMVIIVGIGHVIFSNYTQVFYFLIFLILGCFLTFLYIENPLMNPFTFVISVSIIGLFAFISLLLRLNLSRSLMTASFITDNVNEGIMSVGMNDVILYANQNIKKIIGYTIEELKGKDVKDFLAFEEDKTTVVNKTAKRKAGIADKYELKFRHKEGHIVNTEISATPIYDNNGTANGSVALISDITTRKKVEEELKRKSLIASKTDSYVILTDKEDQIEYVNNSFENFTGYSLEEVKGKRVAEFLRGAETDKNVAQTIENKKESNIAFSAEIKNYTKTGSPVWLSLHVTPILNDEEEVTGYITIGNDITTKKIAEEKLQLDAFRLATIREIDAMIIASSSVSELIHGTIKYIRNLLPANADANISLKQDDGQFCMVTDDGLKASPCSQLPPDKVNDLISGKIYLVKDLLHHPQKTDFEENLITEDTGAYVLIPLIYGNELLGTLNIYWQKYDTGVDDFIEMIQGVVRDLAISIKHLGLQNTITEKNNQLGARLIELEHTYDELRNFSYVVSHDLKAPLRAISSLANWLETDYNDKLDKEGRDYLSLLIGRTNRLYQLIEGILAYSRIGTSNLEKSEIDTDQLVRQTGDLFMINKNIIVTIKGTLPHVTFNEIQLEQIFQNLIGNSVKFMDKLTGEITIGFKETKKHIEFYVKDNGPGIKPEYFEKVFKIFQTLHNRDDLESTGIGLTIVKKIVELNGGKISIDPKVVEGTCIRFTVPKNTN